MPRKARIDAAGAFHHIIVRGIERRKIFWDDADRDFFVNRLGKVLIETDTDCFAWAMIPNHIYLLMRTGLTPISTVMRRLLTGYAVQFNRRHRRHGHLFQNRPARHRLRLQARRAGTSQFFASRTLIYWSWYVTFI